MVIHGFVVGSIAVVMMNVVKKRDLAKISCEYVNATLGHRASIMSKKLFLHCNLRKCQESTVASIVLEDH